MLKNIRPSLGLEIQIKTYSSVLCWIREAPDHLKTQEMSHEVVRIGPHLLVYVPDHLMTQEMCNEAVRENPFFLEHIPDYYKAQEICSKSVCIESWLLGFVSD